MPEFEQFKKNHTPANLAPYICKNKCVTSGKVVNELPLSKNKDKMKKLKSIVQRVK